MADVAPTALNATLRNANSKGITSPYRRTRQTPPSAPWRIERRGGADWQLVNLTNTRKYDMRVSGEPVRARGTNHFDVVDGRETVGIDLFVAWQTRDRRVTVSRRPTPDHTGDPWTQSIGLPYVSCADGEFTGGVVDRPTGQCPVLVMCSIAALSSSATMASSAPSRGGYT